MSNPGHFGFAGGLALVQSCVRAVVRVSATAAAAVAVAVLEATGQDRHIGIALVPKGDGPLTLVVPDGGIKGGAPRGARAVDLQRSRNSAAQVASGADSCAAGLSNTASGAGSIALGVSCTASGAQSVAIGTNCQATVNLALAMGQGAIANGLFSRVWNASSARGIIGADASAVGAFGINADAQRVSYILRQVTTTAAAAALTADAAAAAAANTVALPNDATYIFRVAIVARRTDVNDESAAWEITGCIDRNASAAATALVGTPVVTVIAADAAAAAWTVTATANTTIGGLALTVTGEAGKSIRWVAHVQTVEVVG